MNTLPIEILVDIATMDLETFKAMLAVSEFARYTLYNNKYLRRVLTVVERTNEFEKWTLNGKLHRDDDLPAVVYKSGTREWYRFGKLHRDGDKPAWKTPKKEIEITVDGVKVKQLRRDKIWYKNGLRHREGAPAEEFANGATGWYWNGNVHRDELDAEGVPLPAREFPDGSKYWFIHGKIPERDGPCARTSNGDRWDKVNGQLYRNK